MGGSPERKKRSEIKWACIHLITRKNYESTPKGEKKERGRIYISEYTAGADVGAKLKAGKCTSSVRNGEEWEEEYGIENSDVYI